MTAPVFVDVETWSVRTLELFSPSIEGGLSLPISILIVPLLVMAVLRRSTVLGRGQSRPDQHLVIILIGWLTLSALVGQATHGNVLGLAYYFQTIIPILAFFVGAHLQLDVAGLMRTIVATTLVTITLILLSVVIIEGIGSFATSVDRLAGAIPQYRSYFPGVIAIAVAVAIAHRRSSTPLAVGILIASMAIMPLMWSRAGLLTILTAGLISGMLNATGRGQTILVALASIVISFGVLAVVAEQGVVGDRLQASTASGDLRRATLAQEGFGHVVASPVLGHMFKPEWDTLSGGQRADVTRLFGSHNQFLEYGLRGGFLAMLLFAGILGRTVVGSLRARYYASHLDAAHHSAIVAIVLATSIGSLFQLYYSQPYTGSLIWLLVGLSNRLRAEHVDAEVSVFPTRDNLEDALPTPVFTDGRR